MFLCRTLALLTLMSVLFGGAAVFALNHDRSTPSAADGRPNILIIDIDSLRADRVGGTRNGKPVTPELDSLAARSARFTQAYTHSGWTMPALVSTLTGTLPVALTAADGQVSWRAAGVRDLAGILGLYGYDTWGFWGGTIASSLAGTVMPSFQNTQSHRGHSELPGEAVISWLEQTPKEPFFAYVHDIDLHSPQAFRARKGRIPFDHPSMLRNKMQYRDIFTILHGEQGEDVAKEVVTSRYDGVLHLYDRAVGRMLAALEKNGLASRTVVVVTSDHGEDFFEHAIMEHGLLHDTTLRVPLIIHDPAAQPASIDVLVQAVDLAPTLLTRAGVPLPAGLDGRSLLPLLGGEGEPYVERPLFSLTDTCHVSLRTREYKLIIRDRRPYQGRAWGPAGGNNGVIMSLAAFVAAHPLGDVPIADCSDKIAPAEGKQPQRTGPSPDDLLLELYDLQADPNEQTNLIDTLPSVAIEMLPPLLHTLASRRNVMVGAQTENLSPEQIQALKDNGYWGLVQPGGAGTAASAPDMN